MAPGTSAALGSLKRAPARYLPLVGILIGIVGGGAYWLAANLWPSSIAVALSLAATTVLSAWSNGESCPHRHPSWNDIFLLLVTYNALMALTAASLDFSVPANLALGLVMVCGQAASRGLSASVIAVHTDTPSRASGRELSIALIIGFAPAALLGIPGLMGLAAAVVTRLGLAPLLRGLRPSRARRATVTLQRLFETCFYLGALAAWRYV